MLDDIMDDTICLSSNSDFSEICIFKSDFLISSTKNCVGGIEDGRSILDFI